MDEDGRSVLNKPLLTETKEDDKPAGVDQPPKPNEDFPDCTTYFYHRWMWIQVHKEAVDCPGQRAAVVLYMVSATHMLCGNKFAPKKGLPPVQADLEEATLSSSRQDHNERDPRYSSLSPPPSL